MPNKVLTTIKPRKYQQDIYDNCKDKNCLVVLPTGIGKTLIALMLCINRQKAVPGSKCVFLAPTRPLAEQHLEYFKKHLPELFAHMELFTGKIHARKRKELWERADIVFSTPQCISNDLKNQLYDMKEVSLLIEDECHRCLKNYSYTYVARTYHEHAKNPRVLGLTASPGTDKETITKIAQNLGIEAIELRTRDSDDVKEYLQDEGFRSITGKVVGLSLTYKILKETFYYGEFSYGRLVYQGTHKPIITKELYEKVKENLKTCEKGKWGRKEFFFNKVLKCAECGSGVSGTTHINRHSTQYTYYKCNKYGSTRTCKCKYIREEKLFDEVAKIVVAVKAEHLRLNRRIKEDLDKINRYRAVENPITIQEYLVGILKDGSSKEKSDILRSFKDKLLIKDGSIIIS